MKNTLKTGTWVLVADGAKALFLENVGDADAPDLRVVRKETLDNPPNHEQGTSAPGSYRKGGGTPLSSVRDTDWHQLAEDRFADDLADQLYALAHQGRFRHLVIVAAPRVLGEIRSKLHPEVVATVVADLPKDLTNRPLDKIGDMVRDALLHG